MGYKICVRIVMLSAPTVSDPVFGFQTIYLTTWDQDLTASDGTVYRSRVLSSTRPLDTLEGSSDGSAGNGGLGESLSGSMSFRDVCSLGRLRPLVESGVIPLVNSAVTFYSYIDGTLSAAPNTWYLQEPGGSGARMTMKLCTRRYLDMRLIERVAQTADGAASVGVAVGDPSVVGVGAVGPGLRYKGVSAPTMSSGSATNAVGDTAEAWNFGNPAEPTNKQQTVRKIISASEIVTTTVDTDTAEDGDGSRDFWKYARKAFVFNFESQEKLDAFWNTYIGLDFDGGGWKPLQPNTSLIISDGTNSETMIRRDAAGAPMLGAHNAPMVGMDADSLASRSVTVRRTVDHLTSGTTQAYKGSPNIYQEWIVLNEPLLFAKTYKLRTFNGKTYCSLFVAPIVGGSLESASDAENIEIYVSKSTIPICFGADKTVGFQTKSESGTSSRVVTPPGVNEKTNNGLLTFAPSIASISGFEAWTSIDVSGRIALSDFAEIGTDFTDLFHGQISSVGGKSNFSHKIVCGASSGGSGAPRGSGFCWRAKINSNYIGFTPDYLFVDFQLGVSLVVNSDYTKVLPMLPFTPDNSQYLVANIDGVDIRSIGVGEKLPSRVYGSIDAINKSAICKMLVYANSSDKERSATVGYQSVSIYAVSRFDFGSNPAVVVPGNWPGTSNPTTTPALAAAQIASWLGLSIQTAGGITPSASTWGEYLGPDPSSTDENTKTAKDWLDSLAKEAWLYIAEGTAAPADPTTERLVHPETASGSINDVVTLPKFTYNYAGTSPQQTAQITGVDQSFDPSRGDGYHWSGWQEKDTCHFSASPGSAVLAMCQLEDCLAVACSDGYLRCSYDGGATWPFSLSLYGASSTNGVALAGNGIMVAAQGELNGTSSVYSIDAGRTWTATTAFVGATIQGGWFDATSNRFWLCGADSVGVRAVWYSTDGISWTKISATGFVSVPSVVASGDNILIAGQDSAGKWWAAINTISGGTSIWIELNIAGQGWTAQPFLGRWNGAFRAAVGTTLYSSVDLSTWTSVATPAPLQAFADDGTVVVALAAEPAGGNHVYYSRDRGARWRAVQISPEGFTWASWALTAIWDGDGKCFRFSGWGPARIIALGDPSVLDIWHQCRAGFLATGTLASKTYDWRGLYDASEVVRWLLDCKDGIDPDYQQTRLTWMTRQARFVTVFVEYANIADQLSVAPFMRMRIPRQRLENSRLAQNLPTYGIVVNPKHDPMTGWSSIEFMLPPMEASA